MLRRPPHPLAALSLTPNQRRLRVGLMALGCALCACGSTSGQNSQAPIAPPATRHASADPPWLPEDAHAGVKHQALCDLLKQEWAGSLAHDPLWASDLGVHALDDRLPHRSRSSVAAWQQAQRQYLARGEAIPDAELTPEEQLTKRLFIGQQRSRLGSFACKSELWSIDARDNPLVELNRIPEVTRLDSLSGGHALLARYRAVPGFVDREIQQKRI